ncbi:MAG: DUF3606 domain-containing protein [Xanthobacteraceae bacterium]
MLAELRPRPLIDLADPSAADRWAQKFNVSRDRLVTAVEKVGNSVAAVRRELHGGEAAQGKISPNPQDVG